MRPEQSWYQRGKVELTDQQKEDLDNGKFLRAGKDCICEQCGKTYQQHAWAEASRDLEIMILCDGTLIKL